MGAPQHTPETVEAGLLALAMCGGNAAQARAQLLEQGIDVPETTLRNWRLNTHTERYAQVQREIAPRIADAVAAMSEAFLLKSAETEDLALDQLHAALKAGDIKPGEIAGTMRNLATSRALANDKIIGPLRGRPQIVEHRRSADDLLNRLEQLKLRTTTLSPADVQEVPMPGLPPAA